MVDMTNYAVKHGLQDKDVVAVIKEEHPGYDKYLHSKVKRPDKYGVRLLDSIEKRLKSEHTANAVKPRKKAKRRKPCRASAWLENQKYERLQQAFERSGYKTITEGVEKLIDLYLDEMSEEG